MSVETRWRWRRRRRRGWGWWPFFFFVFAFWHLQIFFAFISKFPPGQIVCTSRFWSQIKSSLLVMEVFLQNRKQKHTTGSFDWKLAIDATNSFALKSFQLNWSHHAVCPDLLHFGQLFKACGKNYFAQNTYIFGCFCKDSKSFILLMKSFLGNFIDIWRLFTGHTGHGAP